eukprot:687346-Pelagomonas_calceolata.AAC.2
MPVKSEVHSNGIPGKHMDLIIHAETSTPPKAPFQITSVSLGWLHEEAAVAAVRPPPSTPQAQDHFPRPLRHPRGAGARAGTRVGVGVCLSHGCKGHG